MANTSTKKDKWHYVRQVSKQHENGSVARLNCRDVRALLAERDSLLECLESLIAVQLKRQKKTCKLSEWESAWHRAFKEAQTARTSVSGDFPPELAEAACSNCGKKMDSSKLMTSEGPICWGCRAVYNTLTPEDLP